MKRVLLIMLLVSPLLSMGQKTKANPVGWSYTIVPRIDLPSEMKAYTIAVDTDLDPMDFWDEVNWEMQVSERDPEKRKALYQEAVNDTIAKWTENYLTLHDNSFSPNSSSPAFTISFTTDAFTVDSIPATLDFSDQETVLGEINVSAHLLVKTTQDETLLEEKIPYYIDDPDGPTTTLRLKHFIANPSFKLKLKLTKKPEKRRKLLTNRIKRYEADILESFMQKAGDILKNHLLFQNKDAYGALFTFKDKEYAMLNEHTEAAREAINALSAFSKKKRKTMDEIRPTLQSAVVLWQEELPKTNNPDVQDALNANIALTSLLLNDMAAAKLHLSNISDVENLESKIIVTGSSNYYLKGLKDAISVKELSADHAKIYQPK